MANIALVKKGKIYRPVRLFNDWYRAGKWSDDNIKSDFQNYYFLSLNKFRTILYKIWLIFI